ncbi:hypothetical protein [Burkholderia cepacia]|uniref:hypothetical protein n=1 Tax=Burkholderia cepacia TaxID=292 RepID=UPI00158873D7|nr:hypothetical protein [Burkholderia cepacia]
MEVGHAQLHFGTTAPFRVGASIPLLFGFSRGARFVRMRHQIRGTYRATRQTWRNVVDFVVANEARLARLISHRLPLHEALQSFELAKSKVSGKVMLIP